MNSEYSALYAWLEEDQLFTSESINNKYGLLFRSIEDLYGNCLKDNLTVLVIGGGTCEVENYLVGHLGLNKPKLISVDFVKPKLGGGRKRIQRHNMD